MPNKYKEYFDKIKAAESGGNKYAKNPFPGQTASGLFQFTKGTWTGLGFDWKDRFDEEKQYEAAEKFTKQNEDYLRKKLGIEPTYADLYLAHFLGAQGAVNLLSTDDSQPISAVMSAEAIKVNPTYTKNKDGSLKTVGEVKALMAEKTGTKVQPNNFTIEGNSGSLSTAGEYKEPKEVQEAKQELVQAQNEENFLNDLSKLFSTQQQVTEEQYQPNYLQQSELFQIQPVQGIQYQEQQPFMYAQDGGIIKDDNGYWNPNNWGKTVEINSPYITMEGVNQPLIGISKQTGEQKIMQPGKKYFFKDTNQVIEKPIKNA